MHVYKSAMNNSIPVVVTLFLGDKSQSNIYRYYIFKAKYAKYRCDKAYVIKIEDDFGNEYDTAEIDNLKIIKNQYIISESYSENIENINGKGIFFFLDKDLARNYKRKLGDQIWNNVQNIYMTFYNNGCNKEKIIFIHAPENNDIIHHSVEKWYENGNKKYEKIFIYNHYQITEWYQNGGISKKYFMNNDKIEGIYN